MTKNSNNSAPRLKRRGAKKRALSAVDEQQVRQWIAVVHRSEIALDRTSPAGRHIRSMDQGCVRYLRGLEFEEGIRRLNDGVISEPLVDASRDCKGRTNFRPPWRSKTRPRTADSLNDEGARSGLFIVCRGS
ncbi:hypothetical protein LPC10_18585 [Methylorubrum sp. B1-46]|uniref:hypothetical protein n=1 Tax=Methylorubrum sp. B1-46 TaxID=2897334 RepID=UPI001E3E8976|nr:hypothetical protein [Methylorubrum sp. B1-46]UGB24905.1 hypothetical protein LPC10_18585 [Methylorubrum sp. B1-46]